MVLSLGFAECVLSSLEALCDLILNAWWTFELIYRETGMLVYSRLYLRQTSGSPVTHFNPVVRHRHLLTRLHGSCPREELSESCHPWTVCFATEGSLQSHYMACAWTWRNVRKKKKSFKNMFEEACVLLLCCFGSFSFCVGFFFFASAFKWCHEAMSWRMTNVHNINHCCEVTA